MPSQCAEMFYLNATAFQHAIRQGLRPNAHALSARGDEAMRLAGQDPIVLWATTIFPLPASFGENVKICPSCASKLRAHLPERARLLTGEEGFIGAESWPASSRPAPVTSRGGRFVAATCCGDTSAWEVVALRRWREEVLIRTRTGVPLVRGYSALSPGLADWLSVESLSAGFLESACVPSS